MRPIASADRPKQPPRRVAQDRHHTADRAEWEPVMTTAHRIPSQVPAGATPEADGIAVGDGAVTVDAFIDFLCPFCRMFEQTAGPLLGAMVADGLATVVYHPMGFLDGLSSTRYSSRAAAASGCASDFEKFPQYAHALFENQPPEGGPGLSDAELIDIADAVGIPRDAVAPCVTGGRYLDWVGYVTRVALARGISGTPSVFVEGVAVPANPSMIAEAVHAVAGTD
jgi:protein-disulfide isomerase